MDLGEYVTGLTETDIRNVVGHHNGRTPLRRLTDPIAVTLQGWSDSRTTLA
jgi:hypothetical protein